MAFTRPISSLQRFLRARHSSFPLMQDESLARLALSVLGDIARHSAALAQAVADTGAVNRVVALLGSRNVKLRRQVRKERFRLSDQLPSMLSKPKG